MTNPNPRQNFDWTPKYSQETKDQIAEFLKTGNTPKEIMEALDVPGHVVQGVRQKLVKRGEMEPSKYGPQPKRAVLVKPGEEPGPRLSLIEDQQIANGHVNSKLVKENQELRLEIQSLKDLLRRYMK